MNDAGTTASPPRSLFRKYFAAFFVAVLVPLVISGAFDAWFGYRDQREMIDRQLKLEAVRAADQIQGFLGGISDQIGWTVHLPLGLDPDQRRLDALRLLRQVPAITELSQVDQSGKEILRVSRIAMDVIGSGVDRSTDTPVQNAVAGEARYGAVYFRQGSEPYVTVSLAGARKSLGISIAEVNLKLIWDLILQIRVGRNGNAFVVDAQNGLIAHPDINRVLRGGDSTDAEMTRRLTEATAATESLAVTIRDPKGHGLIVASAAIPGPRWTVFVEQPLTEAFAPIYAALWRTGALVLAAVGFAGVLAWLLAGRMIGPIQALEEGADRIGSGQFDHRIMISSGDELERLADRFNTMAGELAVSHERSERIARLRQFLAPQVAELVEKTGQDAMLDSHRAEVVAIFCDLRDFTAFSARAEPDTIMGVLGAYYTALGRIITKYEATQTSFSGDGLMMILNAPIPCPEPALTAVRMAVEMQEAVQALLAVWRRDGHAIGFGMGLAQGPATVGRIGYESRLDYTAIGHVVNLASRLCSMAEDGQILMDAASAAATGGAIALASLGPREIKGIDQQVEVYSVAKEDFEVGRADLTTN